MNFHACFLKVSDNVRKPRSGSNLKTTLRPIFKTKSNVPFSALGAVNQELERLDWLSTTVYLKKRTKRSEYVETFQPD